MSIQVSPEVNAMIFILTGERLMDADEDLAFESRRPYSGLGRKLDRLSSLIDKSIHDIGESMPDDLASSYAKAMGMLIDDGGKNYLRDFSDQLDKIAEGRRKTSMDIMESKWQVIAEIIRLLIEIAIYLAMSFFTGGASASQIMMAKLRSRFFILTTLSHLLQRLHLAPSLTEAFAEAFTTFAVRLAMMNFAPDGRRPDGIDWSDIGKAAAFGAAAGFFTSVFEKFAKDIVKSFDGNFLKGGPDLNFKNPPNLRDTPNVDIKTNGPTPNPKPDPDLPGPPKDRPDPNPYGNTPGPTPSPGPVPVTFRDGPLSFRNNPELWRNSQILRLNLDRPGALAGHYALKGTADFIAAGAGEVVAEILIKGAFEGDWSSSWTTFFGAGISSRVESSLMGAALNSGAELRHAIDKLRNQPPPTVSGGNGNGSETGGSDRTEGPSRTDTTGGDGPGPGLSSPPPFVQQTSSQGDFTGSQSPPYVSQDPPPYFSADPPPYTPGPLPVTAAENALWQQVHQGPAEVREQALRDLAALRGSQPPGPAEIGVRDGVHDRLSQLPEVRVVPSGNSPAGQVGTDEVRRALEGFGTPVTVDTPILGERPGVSPGAGTTGGAGNVNSPGTETSSGPAEQSGQRNQPGPDGRTTAPPEVNTSGSYGDERAPGEAGGGPETRGVEGDTSTTAEGPGTGAPPLTVVVTEGPPPVAGSPEAAELLDGAGVDRAVALGPPTGSDATGQPVREAVELTREGPGAPVEVRPLTGPGLALTPESAADTAFPGSNVLLPLADALGVPPVMPAAPPPAASTTASGNPAPASAASPPRSVAQGGPSGDTGAAQPAPGEQAAETQETQDASADTESGPADAETAPRRTESGQYDTDLSSVKVVSGEPAPTTGDLPGPDSKPTVITTTGSEPAPDVKPPLTTTAPEAAPDIKPAAVPASSAPPATPTDVPAASKLAADTRPWTETATDLHLESGRGDGNTTTTPSAAPPPPGQITVRPADPAQDQPPQTLRDFLPEDRWWTFYIDPKNHQAALDAFPDDPGSYYDHDRSPGFQQGMVSAYTQFLGDPGTVATPMDSTSYRTMHGLATGHLGRTIGWSGGGATQFPLRGETLADDIFDERVGDHLLVYDTTSRDWSKPLPTPRPITILTRFLHNNPSLATNYGKSAAPGLVDTLFQQHYARVSDPDADDAAKLASIVRTIRALHVVHPFQDGNLRSNVQILLPKLLLEQGLRPVVPDNMYSLFQGGRSVPQMVDSLIRNGALDTGGPRPPQGETAADPHLESGRDGDMDTSDTPVAPITTSTTDGDGDGDGTTPAPTTGPSVTTLDRKKVPFSELRRFVPQTALNPQPGTAVRTLTISQGPAEDGTGRSAGREALLGQDSFRGVRTTQAEPPPPGSTEPPPAPRTVFTGPPTALPGSGTERGADYFVGHGTPRTVTLGTDNAAYPTVKVSGVQLGEVLKSWAQEGDQERPLVLFSCETGQQPKIAGLPVAQHVANRTGRPVYAPTTEAGTAKDRDGNVRAVLGEGPDGPGRWRLFTPEPAGTALDDLARDAGLHASPGPADAFARARTLQQIRTLREVLSPDAEQHPGNKELLAALAYVDGLRWRDPGTAARYGDGRMTPDLLDRMVTDWHTATNGTNVDPATGPTPQQYTAFLEAAAGLRAGATPATTLDILLPPPPPELPPDTLVSQPDVLGLAYARSAQITWSLSNAPLPLSELGLGADDTAELARRLHHPELAAPTGRQDAPGPEGTPPPPALPVNSLVVNAYTARHTYGIPEKNFAKFRDVARDRSVVVDVRPTNPSAPGWLDAGAMPKPQDVKAKTVNEVDVLLGADAGNVGLVGYFRPVLPDQGSVPVDVWDRVVSRFNQRSMEFHELAGKMAQYEVDGRFTVHDGIVFGFDDAGGRRPITGDHDLFDVSSPDGSRLSHPEHDALIEEMRAKDMAVVHGAHMFWNPPTAFDKSVFDKIVSSHAGPTGAPLLRFSPGNDHAELVHPEPSPESPPPARPESIAEDMQLSGEETATPGLADTVHTDGQALRRLHTRADGDCLFRSLLDTARSHDVPPAWAARNVAGLRSLLRDRLTGSELLAPDVEATPDPVLAVVDDLRMTALAGVRNPEAREWIGQRWDRIGQAVVTDGDGRRWRRILRDSGYPHLADVAPTPADARKLGTDGLIVAAAELPALWSSPFADALPLALAHTLDIELRLVRPDASAPAGTSVTPLNPGGHGGTLHLAYNGSDHYDALVPAAAVPTPTPAPIPSPATPDPAGTDVFGEWLRSMGGVTDLHAPTEETPDRGDPVPLETQLERHRPARLLTGEDARPPGPAPRTVTFDDGSRLPTVLISPDADPDDGPTGPGAGAGGTPRTGLLNGLGVLTLRSPEQVAEEVFGQLPKKLRAQFDEAELLRLLKDQPGAFTAPRGARFVGREKSGVGHEMVVEAVPYHRWERFGEAGGATVRLDTMRRGQSGTGGGRSVGVGRRVAAALGMGPPLNWMLKIGVSLGWTRRTDYTQGTQAYHQSEYRAWEGSHLHLDDVHYRVRVERVTEAPKTPAPTPPGPGTAPAATPRWQRSEVHSAAFAMRDGLSWRLPDDLTVPFKGPKRAPETLTFPDGAEPRITDTTALHLTDPPEDVALAISGARPGSSAHRTLVSYVRPGRLLGLFGRFAGPVSGPELTRGSGQHPLGHLIVERSIPHRATLVTESVKAEVRDLAQTTYQNQRAHVRDTRLGVQVTAGPNYTLIGPETDVRLQGGPLVRTDLSTGRGHYLGADAARKVTGRVRNHPMALYRVERTLMVRKAGQPASAAQPVRVVSLDWYSTQDARRLAGWDSRTPGATGPNPDAEPPVPWYLTRQDPVHLGGQVRAEGFVPDRRPAAQPAPATTTTAPAPAPAPAPQDPLKAFTDTVLDTLHRAYPTLFVPPLMLRHPHLAKLWYGDGRMRTALHNERQVREALNRPSLAQSLDDLTTTGVPVTLTEDGKVRRGHHTLILRARLTDRQFETTLSERSLRNAVVGTEVSGQGQQESTTLSAGVELGISPRDHDKDPAAGVPRQAGNVSLGARYAQTRARATKNTVAVAHDQLTFQNGADLYSYQVELGATFEGHRRPRGWTRLVTVGLLGAGVFVSKVTERPLFTRGTEPVGRVELAVPAAHGSDRHAPADPPATGPAPVPAPTPAPSPLASTEADQLLDGTRPLPRTTASDRQLVNKLLSAPHVVLSAEGGEQRQRLVQDTADRATGSSWHVSAPGTPIRTALRRAMANLGVAGQLGQYLGPFGSRITGLTGAGPFSTHYLKAAVRGELDNVRVKSDPKPGSLEATIGNEHRVAGTSSTGTRTTLGLQGGVMPLQQVPGQQALVGAYSTALQYAWGKGRSISQTLTRGRNTTLSYAGRMYLVVADATETVAVRDRWTAAMGAVGTRAGGGISSAAGRISERLGRGLAPRRAAAALQRVRDAVMFHLPMQDAIEAGLAPDGLGTTTPANLGGGYKLPPFLRRRHFPSHPSGQLDASRAAQQLMGQLERMGVPSHDREQVLQRLSPDFLRSHVHELTTDGMALPVRYRTWTSPHHLPVGGSPGQLQLTLTPVTTTVERLRTGYELEDYRTTARDDVEGRSQDRGADVTLSASERAAGSGVLVANPALQGTAAKQRSSNVTEAVGSTAMPNIATTQAHAEIVTTYTLTATLVDASGKPLGPTATAPVGSLNEILPASLLTPDGAGADGAITEQDVREPDRAVHVLTADQARPEGIARWRTTDGESGEADPDILPFDDVIGSGILAVDILGSANVQDALTLATARADGFPGDTDLGKRHTGTPLTERVRMARHTPLTSLGTAPAQAQQEATSQVGLSAGFREALGPDGSPLPTQSSARLLGQSHTADSRLYAKMHRTGARLLAVENKPRMEAMQRRKTGDALDAGITDNIEGAVSTAPLAGNSNAGVTNPGATVPIGGANDATALRSATDTTLGTHIKVVTDRSMLFAVPVSWLSVAEVDHRVTDSRPMRALGKPRRGPRAVEAETTALVWLREDIARDYGLLDDTTFPDEVRTAWDDQAKAAADLATAEKNYYDARAKSREAWLDLSPEERTALGDGAGATTPSPVVDASPAVTAWRAARDDVRRWQQRLDAAAQDHHRLHLAAARLTAHHQGSGSVPVKDVPQEYTAPDWRSEAPEPYKVTDATHSLPRTLTSPDGRTVHQVHEVPHDGASFFHALLATAQDQGKLSFLLGADLADRFAAAPGDPAVTTRAVDAVRDRLAWALADDGNEDLLDGLALDAADTFTQAELDYAEIDLTAAQQTEFNAFGRLPQTVWPTPEQRVALATAALYRPFTAEPTAADPAGGDSAPPERRAADHGGADVLPALAARVLGTPVTVVTGEGRPQMFLPHGADPATADPASGPVLFAADGFFAAALAPGTVPPPTTALPAPPATTGTPPAPPKPPTHRSHPTPPWLPPADATGPRYRLDRDGLLTAPDGATYTQGAPAGRGNGFFAALSTALRHAAEQPGRDPRAAARLRTRAGASPLQLMRLNGLPGERAERGTLFSPPAPGDRKSTPALSQDARDGRLRRHLANAPWGPDADRAVAEWAAKATGATVTLVEENGTTRTYAGPSADAPVLRLRRRGGDFVPLLLRTPAPPPKKPETAVTGEGPGLPGEEEAYELSTLSGAQPHHSTDADSDGENEDVTPIWADPEWLTAVFGPQWSRAPRLRLQETSEALYELVEEAAGGRTTRAGLADLVRHVLHLPTRARVTNQDVLDLGALALEASSDDLATAEDLAVYFVDRQIEARRDALAEETQLRTADRTPAGRDFTGSGRGLPAPDSYVAERSGRAAEQNAAWRNPYLFVAEEAEGGGVEIVTPWRTFVVREAEEMARIISYDSRRPGGADIVLALPPAFAAQVADLVAGTTARPVWYPLRPAEVATHPTTGAAHLVVHRRAGETGPDWTTPPPPQEPGLPGARDHSGDGDSDDGRGSDAGSDSGSTSDGDAEFDRLADQAQHEHRIDDLRPRPLVIRDYQVIDDSGTGVLFTEPGPRTVGPATVGEVRTEEGAEGPALVLPQQTPATVIAADHPPLHISADRTVALRSAGDDTTGRGRQVYATRAAIERSSARLAAAGAGVRLAADPSVRVVLDREDGTLGEPLFRVEPRFLTASGASEHAFTRDFARMVAGTDAAPLSHLAFRASDGTVATAPVNGLHGREVTGTHHLAQALTEVADGTRTGTDVTPDWAVRQAGRDPRFTGGVVGAPTPGEAYGRALSHTQDNTLRGPLTQAAARAGVNEFAWAEVGEGYLIQSVSTTNDGGAQLFTHNHAKPGDPVGPHAPYHFGQVVLASEDGTHQITLENETHSRTGIPPDQFDAVVDDNLDRYDEDRLNLLAQETEQRAGSARRDGADPAEIARLEGFARAARALAAVHEAEHVRWHFTEDRPEHALAQREVDQARARARDAVRSAAPVPHDRDQWYFRAYSKRPGESAHAVNAALLSERSPAVSNPLTTVVLHGHALRPDRRTVRFAEQQHTLPPGADENLDALALYLARTGLWNSANGLPLPTVTVTGHGNRSRASGEKRAAAVGKELGDRLARLLRTFQEGAPGPHLRLSDFTLALDAQRVRRATDPDRGRVVTVDVDDRRQTPPPASGRPAPAGEPLRAEPPALPRPTGRPAPEGPPPAVTDPATGTTGSRTSSDGEPSRPGRRSATPSPDRGVPVPAWVQARIRYAEESVTFERRLAEHLAENEAVTEEFRKMARAAWDRVRQQYPPSVLATFGSDNPSMPGTVGTSRPALQQVLRTGNLRELVTFLFQGISSDLVPETLGGREDPNPEIEAERPSRRQAEGRAELERLAAQLNLDDTLSVSEKQAALARATQEHTVQADPDGVRPPLSRAERPFAVVESGLTWMPASSVYDLAMSSGLQETAEDSGGLVLTGTAGSTYRFLVHAARMRDRWGLDLDLGLIRAGMIAMSLSVGHHSFHEVMRGAQLALDSVPGHDLALDYQDNWGRYWRVHPLTEQELRDHVARDGRFPDEHAQDLLDEVGGATGVSGGMRSGSPRPLRTTPSESLSGASD
ncbi:hypothetical protein PV390_00955 [Streptomyces sp. ME02-6991-2A]|nr:hypothetical protein [Streptomyces sp. ME02-6991-2A]MDX3372959.1 hypothetical protein [Streptomyces sp. ME02-6991-2A]